MLKFPAIMFASLALACASGADVTPQDFTQGMPTDPPGNNTMMPPTPGAGGQEQTLQYPDCRSTSECFADEVCDPSSASCVDPSNMGQGSSADAGMNTNQPVDMNTNNPVPNPMPANGCSSTPDIQVFQVALVCNDGCADDFEAENARCQQTPSRLVDCLASAAQARNECDANCPDLSRSMTACLGVCLNDADVGNCARVCFAQSFSLTGTCHDCFAAAFECGGNTCQSVCISDTSDECGSCLQSSCGQAFEQCAGIPLP
jgi:hypothetical protein